MKRLGRLLSASQHAGLKNLAAGRDIGHHVYGRSQSGGFGQTIMSLRRLALIDANGNLTNMGREAADTGRIPS